MSVEHLEFRLLKYIVAVVDAGGFTAAAAKVHVSQSALSTQIARLENVLGIRIFDRKHGTRLTPEGRILVRYARESLRTREHIVRTVQAIHAGKLMPLRLGFTHFVDNFVLRSVTELYKELLPESDFSPENSDTDEITNRVRESSLDAAIVTLPIVDTGLDTTVIERERLEVCMRSDDPLAERGSIPPNALTEKISVFTYQRHHPGAHARLVEMFEELGVTLRPSHPMLNFDHIQWFVKEGVCYSLVPANRPLMNGLITKPITGVDWTIDTAFVTKAEHQNPALSWFVEELRKHIKVAPDVVAKKSVVSVPAHDVGRKPKVRARANQIALFGVHDELGDDRHLRKTFPHRKELLDE